ncbi:type 2 isopentenyl-diphosphate Delta-isomerase [bacterium]|nr:type 2 isopentenyl-diphosphate Delta-isomerase [bacterium]
MELDPRLPSGSRSCRNQPRFRVFESPATNSIFHRRYDSWSPRCSPPERGFGVGSQRRELERSFEDLPLRELRRRHPSLPLISNLGVSQLASVSRNKDWNRLRALLEETGASSLAIHLNPLQEAIQTEGTPQFKGALLALEECIEQLSLPLILKETGSGMSRRFLDRIARLPLHAVDVSGLGGTHWGRIEGMRAAEGEFAARYGRTFKHWGIPTPDSIVNARNAFFGRPVRVWASGGIRSGLDAAKCLALGASAVGFARPALEAAIEGEKALHHWMEVVEGELRIAMFCTNSGTLRELDASKIEGESMTTNLKPEANSKEPSPT